MLSGSELKYLTLISDLTFTPFHAAFSPITGNPGHLFPKLKLDVVLFTRPDM